MTKTVHSTDIMPFSQTSNSTPQPIQEEVPPESEQIDIKILGDLQDVTDVPEEHFCDFDSWAHSVLKYQWQNDI